MVPGAGIEPARYCYRKILSLVRLPISPPGLTGGGVDRSRTDITLICNQLHNHSATTPCLLLIAYHYLNYLSC